MWFISNWQDLIWSLAVVVTAAILGLIFHRIFYGAARRVTARTSGRADDLLVQHSVRPTRLIAPAMMMLAVTPGLPLREALARNFRHALVIVLIGGVTWLLVSLLDVVGDLTTEKYDVTGADNLESRRIKTQVHVLQRIAAAVLMLLGFAVTLMTFPTIWNIGAGLFASAGAAGLIVGMAAKPTLSSLLAGIQIALTQPIRLDDVVIVEGEWGRIEEIRTTYVVVRIWDQRRLILPLTYFIEHPFQNWTRSSAEILGAVFLHVDYTLPIEELRAELERIVNSTDLWDGRVWRLHVTNATDRSVEVRALVSARNSGDAWELRCLVREQLIQWVQRNYPQCLPRTRAELPAGWATAEPAQAN